MNIHVLLAGIGVICMVTLPAEATVITTAGSTTVLPAVKACAKSYQAKHAGIHVISAGGGSSKGVSTVGRGKVDVGAASRAVKGKEKSTYPELKQYQLGTDGVVMVVHADNDLSNLTADQVSKLYNGEFASWAALGGAESNVNLVTLGKEHGTYELFSKYFKLRGEESEGNIVFGKGHAWIAFSQDVALDRVAHDKSGIAFASIGVASAFAEKSGRVKLLSIDGIAATEANVSNGSYKLVRPLLMLTNGDAKGEVRNFMDYLLGQECQATVKALGYIPVR
ncbi:phosphate transport system substrate-binding protein [Mariprofundus micogutta]|uniref:Phosphate transport system substrate-binding protein n=1 Tax=Mariprofundus micogutta TaxID=1921010 RepID=A0A1L8CMA5_9PROT|nr:phosphate ABC transporter substrate-binding protein [Mariprofundus micogutta]GAV19979.1 phosphate transport system substrate-binding protein [Mariprofundus micogutta]